MKTKGDSFATKRNSIRLLAKTLIGLCMVICAIFIFRSPGKAADAVASRAACNHTYQWVTTVKSTCTTGGHQDYKCTKCGHVLRGQDTPSNGGHNWQVTSTVPSTCTTTGATNYKCSKCGQTKSETIAKKAHNYQWVTTVQSTCETGGKEERRCTVCGHVVDGHDTPSNGGHNWQVTGTTDSTCTSTGSRSYRCSKCGATKSETIGKKDHNYQWVTVIKSTCTTGGKEERKCVNCGHVIDGHDTPSNGGHNWQVTGSVDSTCTATGYTNYKCSKCGETKSETIGKKAHNYKWVQTIPSGCTTGGKEEEKCTVCGHVLDGHDTPPNGHAWQLTGTVASTCAKAGSKNYKCSRCGETKSEALPLEEHTYEWVVTVQPTCAKAGKEERKCKVCGHVIDGHDIPVPAHDYKLTNTVDATCTKNGTKTYTCSRCGATKTETIKSPGHTYKWVTTIPSGCTTGGKEEEKCTVCGHVLDGHDTPPNGHAWQVTETVPSTCAKAGIVKYKCSRCGETKTDTPAIPAHNYQWVTTVKSTCTTGGKEERKCTVCGHVIDGHDTPPNGHGACSWVTATKPTSSAAGKENYVCSVCKGVVKSRALYLISYNANGGSGAPSAQTKTQGVAINLSSTVPTRSGYTFLGWSASSTSVTASYNAGASYTADKNITLYAVWQGSTCYVAFDANGGSGTAPAKISVKRGGSVEIPKSSLTREGFYFLGWSTSKTATAAAYKSGSSLTLNNNITLYAVWQARTWTISFDANGGTGSIPTTRRITHGNSVVVGTCTLKRDNYYFMGWAEDAKATSAKYNSASSIVMTKDVKLYAVWKPQNRTLSFNANGGKGTLPTALTAPYGQTVTIGPCNLTREGYYFLGWARLATATSATHKTGSTLTLTSNTTLYAVWSPKKWTVSFHPNGGRGTLPASFTVGTNVAHAIGTANLSREGYYFLGWATSQKATQAQYTSKTTIKVTKDTVLYAVWKPQNFTLTFNLNGGASGAPAKITAAYGSTVTIPSAPSIKHNGKSVFFLGWSTTKTDLTATNEDVNYISKADETHRNIIILKKDVTLYAVWRHVHTFDSHPYNNNGIHQDYCTSCEKWIDGTHNLRTFVEYDYGPKNSKELTGRHIRICCDDNDPTLGRCGYYEKIVCHTCVNDWKYYYEITKKGGKQYEIYYRFGLCSECGSLLTDYVVVGAINKVTEDDICGGILSLALDFLPGKLGTVWSWISRGISLAEIRGLVDEAHLQSNFGKTELPDLKMLTSAEDIKRAHGYLVPEDLLSYVETIYNLFNAPADIPMMTSDLKPQGYLGFD